MDGVGDTAPDRGLVHAALIYRSDEEFLKGALPVVQAGISASEPVLVAARARNVELMRSALGGEPEGVTMLGADDWFETSALTRQKYADWASQRTRAERVRMIGEPSWAVDNATLTRDWARHEAVVNVAFAELPFTCLCPYDARALPGEIVEHARHTHPTLAEPGGWHESQVFEEPLEFCRRLDSQAARPAGNPVAELDFDLAELGEVRRVTARQSLAAGMTAARADEVALAVNEIAANALMHGAPPATLRFWRDAGGLTCEVSDAGHGIEDGLAGQLAPSPTGLGGRGLWLARTVCDAVEIRNTPEGCTVSLHARGAGDGSGASRRGEAVLGRRPATAYSR